jgi:hypothetical protein
MKSNREFIRIEWSYIEIIYKNEYSQLIVNFPSGILEATLIDNEGNILRHETLNYEIVCSLIALNFPDIDRIGIY